MKKTNESKKDIKTLIEGEEAMVTEATTGERFRRMRS